MENRSTEPKIKFNRLLKAFETRYKVLYLIFENGYEYPVFQECGVNVSKMKHQHKPDKNMYIHYPIRTVHNVPIDLYIYDSENGHLNYRFGSLKIDGAWYGYDEELESIWYGYKEKFEYKIESLLLNLKIVGFGFDTHHIRVIDQLNTYHRVSIEQMSNYLGLDIETFNKKFKNQIDGDGVDSKYFNFSSKERLKLVELLAPKEFLIHCYSPIGEILEVTPTKALEKNYYDEFTEEESKKLQAVARLISRYY